VEPLVSKTETRLADGGLLAIFAGVLARFAIWFALTRSNPLLDIQLVAGALLVAALNFSALLLPRGMSGVPVSFGLLGWLYALTLLPRYFSLWQLGERPDSHVYGALGLAALSFIVRLVMTSRWSREIHGKGWAWIDHWAQQRSLRARVLAKRALITLGYRRARNESAAQ
jgi:hypothetical protein